MPTSDLCQVSNFIPVLNRYARHLSGTPDQAEDLAQETLLRVLDRLGRGQEIQLMRPYLFATMRNLHRQKLRQHVEICELEDATATEEPEAFRAIACKEVRAAIKALPEDQALLVTLVMQGETSPSNLALRTGLAEGTVMSRLSRARKRLRRELGLQPGFSVTTLFDAQTGPT